MWGTPVTTAITAEPVTLEMAKGQCQVDDDDTSWDSLLIRLIKTARAHCESVTGLSFAVQTVDASCTSYADLSSLPVAPVTDIDSIGFTDDPEALDGIVELVPDRFAPTIALKSGEAWPALSIGSRIAVTLTAGGDAPEEAVHAMLLLIGHWFRNREAVNIGNITSTVPMGVDSLLANHRRWS